MDEGRMYMVKERRYMDEGRMYIPTYMDVCKCEYTYIG